MSDIGKLQRPETAAMDATELGGERELPALEDPALARERAGGELKYRASGGARGVAPMQRLMDERRAMGGQLAARVQRKADAGGVAGNVAIPESGGTKLPDGVRAKMEPKLGADLSDVRVHTGGESAQAATGIGARAFTVGSDVHFNAGEFAPGSKEGDRLLAHELTHVVQGKKSGVQRKAAPQEGAAAEGAAAGGAAPAGAEEVSHPDEPAEKEADSVADGVADSIHGGDKKGGAGGKGKDKDKKAGAHGRELGAQAHGAGNAGHGGGDELAGHEAAHVQQQGGGEHVAGEGPAEKPAPISAKFSGVGRKIMRAKKGDKTGGPADATPTAAPVPPVVAPGTISGVSSTKSAVPSSKKTDDPSKFTLSKAKYDANFSSVKANIVSRGGTPEQANLFEGRKGEWYSRWGNAALKSDADAAKAQFTSIQADFKTMFPDDKPSKDGGHLYSGRSGAGTGRQRAEQAMETANGKPENKAAGITHRTLETTLVGNMFDGVANDPRDPAEKDKWIPYGGSQAAAWWSQISASYADTFVGEVHCHVDVGMPYFVGQMAKGKASAAEARKPESLAPLIALQASVFRDDELPKIGRLMGMGRVTKCTFELRIEVTPGVFKNASPSIPGAGISTGEQLIAAINSQLKGLVTPAELAANIPDPAAPKKS